MLFIQDATGDGGTFERVADLLADEFTVVTYDRRGNSRSPRPADWTNTSTEEQANLRRRRGELRDLDLALRERMLGNGETPFGIEFGIIDSYRPTDETLAEVEAPVQVAIGTESTPFFGEAARWLADRLDAEMVTLTGAHTLPRPLGRDGAEDPAISPANESARVICSGSGNKE